MTRLVHSNNEFCRVVVHRCACLLMSYLSVPENILLTWKWVTFGYYTQAHTRFPFFFLLPSLLCCTHRAEVGSDTKHAGVDTVSGIWSVSVRTFCADASPARGAQRMWSECVSTTQAVLIIISTASSSVRGDDGGNMRLRLHPKMAPYYSLPTLWE